MRVLFSTVSPASYMRPPLLGDEQVNCGPDWSDVISPEGRIESLVTPVGEYDLGAVLARLSDEQQPDVAVCLVDSSWRNIPRNLAAVRCPRVLLVADTHHLDRPLTRMLRYALEEPFDRIVLLYDRHHARFFCECGLRNLFWFPGLTFPHSDAVVRAARSANRRPQVAFVGQAGPHHPRRRALLATLVKAGVPLSVRATSQSGALFCYGQSLVGFNGSLNGDLNLRTFEILASGAALLTDRLAPSSGWELLWTEGKEALTFGSAGELRERAAWLLSHTTAAREIGASGCRWFDERFSESRRRAEFAELAFDGRAAFPLEIDHAPRSSGRKLRYGAFVESYEQLQEMHRWSDRVRVALGPGLPSVVGELLAGLPHLDIGLLTGGSAQIDFAVVTEEWREEGIRRAGKEKVFVWRDGEGT